MTRIVITKHLAYEPHSEAVLDRISIAPSHYIQGSGYLGNIYAGPIRPIPQEVQSEWLDLIEWEAMRQGEVLLKD